MAGNVAVLMALSFACGYLCRWRGFPHRRWWGVPFVRKGEFAIATATTGSPFDQDMAKTQPCLTKRDVTDVRADAVADPFLYYDGRKWYMFMEVINRKRKLGEIGLAVSLNGIDWDYRGIVLREPFHLSYPCVVEDAGHVYMIPETRRQRSVRLYKAIDFPGEWRFEKTLLDGHRFTDPTVFHCNATWWMFVSCMSNDLLLYYADSLYGPWNLHPRSPIIYNDPSKARCGGRPLNYGKKWIRFAQNCQYVYGQEVNAFEITTLSRTEYSERPHRETPVLKGMDGSWNAGGMHHLDIQPVEHGQYVMVVDGWSEVREFSLMMR